MISKLNTQNYFICHAKLSFNSCTFRKKHWLQFELDSHPPHLQLLQDKRVNFCNLSKVLPGPRRRPRLRAHTCPEALINWVNCVWGHSVAHVILVSAQVLLVLTFGLWTLGLRTRAWQYHIEPIKHQFMINTAGYSYVQSTNHIWCLYCTGEWWT